MTKPLEQVLSVAERDRIRTAALDRPPRWYSPWAHLAVTSVFGVGTIVTAIVVLHHVRWWEYALAVGWLVVANASEWRIHKDVMHRREWLHRHFPPAAVLYDRHTPEHHMIFLTDDMSIRHSGEFRLVLIPAYGIILIFFGLLPLFALVWWLGEPNVAALFAVVSMSYVVSYEWLHLAYHLPPDSWVGSRGLVRVLRRHHALHHDPRLMQRWNFNVTLPLWDLLRGTFAKDRESVIAKATTKAA